MFFFFLLFFQSFGVSYDSNVGNGRLDPVVRLLALVSQSNKHVRKFGVSIPTQARVDQFGFSSALDDDGDRERLRSACRLFGHRPGKEDFGDFYPISHSL